MRGLFRRDPAGRAGPGRCKQLGVGVLIAFTVKGICSTGLILVTLASAATSAEAEMLAGVAVWLASGAGGLWALGRGQPALAEGRGVEGTATGQAGRSANS